MSRRPNSVPGLAKWVVDQATGNIEEVAQKRTGGKKRHGEWEVWVRYTLGGNMREWRRRTYETRVLAEKNAAKTRSEFAVLPDLVVTVVRAK